MFIINLENVFFIPTYNKFCLHFINLAINYITQNRILTQLYHSCKKYKFYSTSFFTRFGHINGYELISMYFVTTAIVGKLEQ